MVTHIQLASANARYFTNRHLVLVAAVSDNCCMSSHHLDVCFLHRPCPVAAAREQRREPRRGVVPGRDRLRHRASGRVHRHLHRRRPVRLLSAAVRLRWVHPAPAYTPPTWATLGTIPPCPKLSFIPKLSNSKHSARSTDHARDLFTQKKYIA